MKKVLGRNAKRRVKPELVHAAPGDSEADPLANAPSGDITGPLTAIRRLCKVLIEKYGGNLPEQCREYVLKIDALAIEINERIGAKLESPRIPRGETRAGTVDLGEM